MLLFQKEVYVRYKTKSMVLLISPFKKEVYVRYKTKSMVLLISPFQKLWPQLGEHGMSGQYIICTVGHQILH